MAQLHLLNRNGTWYYRRVVPKHLVDRLGFKLVQQSLDTKDLAVAKKRREIADVHWSQRFEQAQQGAVLRSDAVTGAEMAEIVRAYVVENMQRFLRRENENPAVGETRREAMQNVETELAILRDPGDPRADQWVSFFFEKLLSTRGNDPKATSPQGYSELAELVRRALLEVDRRKLAHFSSEFGSPFFDTLFDPARPRVVTFKELTEQYCRIEVEEAEANATSRKWIDKIQSQVVVVRELIGDDKLVDTIDYDTCLEARRLLARLPSNRNKLYPGLELGSAIALGEKEKKPLLSPTTQARYLDTLRDILDLACRKGILLTNPAAGMRPLKRDTVGASEKRLPFSDEQICAFFSSEFYQRCAPNSAAPYLKVDREWRFWLPLMSLFMGMRPNEVCQMVPSDVKCTVAGTWYVDVVASPDDEDGKPEANGKTVKTGSSRRKIPIHPELLALGFVEFATKKQKEKVDRLFAHVRPDQYGNWATYSLKRFRDTFLPEAIEVGPKQTFYSFRHSFRDALRRSKAGADVLQALGGWSQGNVTSDSYGDKSNPDLYADAIALVAFPGLDLSFLKANAKN